MYKTVASFNDTGAVLVMLDNGNLLTKKVEENRDCLLLYITEIARLELSGIRIPNIYTDNYRRIYLFDVSKAFDCAVRTLNKSLLNIIKSKNVVLNFDIRYEFGINDSFRIDKRMILEYIALRDENKVKSLSEYMCNLYKNTIPRIVIKHCSSAFNLIDNYIDKATTLLKV